MMPALTALAIKSKTFWRINKPSYLSLSIWLSRTKSNKEPCLIWEWLRGSIANLNKYFWLLMEMTSYWEGRFLSFSTLFSKNKMPGLSTPTFWISEETLVFPVPIPHKSSKTTDIEPTSFLQAIFVHSTQLCS